jgi:hypothetical protein
MFSQEPDRRFRRSTPHFLDIFTLANLRIRNATGNVFFLGTVPKVFPALTITPYEVINTWV